MRALIDCVDKSIATGHRSMASMERFHQMVTVALLARLEAKPGKEAEVAQFLADAQTTVMGEPDTVAWFAVQFGPSTFGIFDAFPNDAGRQAHLAGAVATALMERADELFAQPPSIEQLDVLASKLA